MRFLDLRFSARLILFSTVLVSLTVGLSSFLAYRAARADLERRVGIELLAIAQATAALIDTDLIDLVYRNEDGQIALHDEFETLRDQLDRVRVSVGLPDEGSPLYIMRPSDHFEQNQVLEFVVMPDPDDSGRYFVGNVYRAEPHNVAALEGQPGFSCVYDDGEGLWISASAPLYDSTGRLVGLIQVDRTVDFLTEAALSHAYTIGAGATTAILAGIILSFLLSRSLLKPLREIAGAVKFFGDGDLDHRLRVERRDEIGELARGFNDMAERLQQAQHARDAASRALITSGRLAAVGELASGVAHEISSPLSYVRTNLTVLRSHWEKLSRSTIMHSISSSAMVDAGEILEESIDGVDRALDIANDIRGFAHAGGEEREEVDLNDMFNAVMRVAAPQLPGGTRVVRNFAENPMLTCAPQEMKQVLLNLVLNASQAIAPGGRIEIETASSDQGVVASVSDDGHGIDESLLDRIFDPFFTTKPVGQGTGLGLAISYEIVRRHGGQIVVEAIPDGGTRFDVIIPSTVGDDDQPGWKDETAPEGPRPGAG